MNKYLQNFKLHDYSKFIVTGFYYNSKKRFRMVYPATMGGVVTALHINLWRGKVWGITHKTNHRRLLKSVFNY